MRQLVPSRTLDLPVRVRRSGPAAFADVVLQVERGLTLEAAHDFAHAAEDAVRDAVPGTDIVVHAEPGEPSGAESVG